MSLIPFRRRRQELFGRESAPLSTLGALRGEMDRLFDRFVREPWGWAEERFPSMMPLSPAVDVSETEKEITIRAELPGLEPEDIEISVSGNMLTLAGEKRESSEHKGEDFYHCERHFGSFRRTIELPSTADPEHVEAEDRNGVLTIHVGKVVTAKPRKITVRATKQVEAKPKAEPAMAGAH